MKGCIEMVNQLIHNLGRLLHAGHARTVKAKKHILASFFLKGTIMVIAFVLVPIVLGYIHKEQYGIWLTLSSIIGWLSFFDLGLGHGMRNKLSESLAQGDTAGARTYVSTTYAILILIFGSLWAIFLVVNPFLDWTVILNTSAAYFQELRLVALVVFTCYSAQFILQMMNMILYADQRPAINDLLLLIGKVITLVAFLLLAATTEGSLLKISLVYGFVPILTLLAFSLIAFRRQYRLIAPSIRFVDFTYARDLMDLGVKFFVIGLTMLVIFSTDHMIIIQLFGPAEVPAYALSHKYFGLITMAFTIISAPFWSAYTEAFVKNDLPWIRSTHRGLIRIWGGFCILGLIMLAVSGPFFRMWVPELEVPFVLNVFMLVYVVVLTWGTIFVTFINGVGKIKLQLVVASIGALLNIPLSIFFAQTLGLGSPGVILASTICIGFGPFIGPIQFKKIVTGTAKGIWDK